VRARLRALKPDRTKKPERQYSARPYEFDRIPRRDARFPDPFNMGVNAEVFLYEEQFPPQPKTLMMFYKRLREIDVPEMMASIITETPNKPWDYYRDMTRQLWDEARPRHDGRGWFRPAWDRLAVPGNDSTTTWSLALNTQLKPIRAPCGSLFHRAGTHAQKWQTL